MSNPTPKVKNKWFTLYLLVSSADNFCNDLGRRSERQNVGPNLDLNYSTLWWYSLNFFSKKLIFKKSADAKNTVNKATQNVGTH